jgi:PAS domain S-box-containing protein
MAGAHLAREGGEEALVRANEALAEESELLRVTLASIGDGVISVDVTGRVISLNKAAQELTGWSQEEACGRPFAEIFPIVDEETRAPAADPVAQALREGRVVALANHTVLVARDGKETPIDDSAAPIRDEGGNVHGVVLVFRSVAERKRAERDRRRAEEATARLAAIVESSQDAIVSKTLGSVVLSWNAGAEELFGWRAEEMIGQSITRIIPPERHDEERVILERLARGERVEHYETVRVTKHGRRLDVSLTISPVRDGSGRIVGASKIARDITERKKAERTTRFLADASAALARITDHESTLQLVATLAVPLFADWCAVDVVQADGSIRRIAVAHADPEKVQLVRELERRYPPRPADRHGVRRVIRSGEVEWAASIPDELLVALAHDAEHLRLARALGLRSYVCVPLRSRGRVLGALTFVDAESGRAFDANDVRVAEDLASRAVIAMENATLLATLRDADRRKDEFLAMLAHELRNPLAPIRNAAHIFRAKGAAVPELQWAADVIDRQVHQMTRLVDDLLDVSRITRGKIELRRERVELAAVVRSAVEATRPLVEKSGHELTVSLPGEPVHLEADPTRLAQVLSNLLNNAAKYTDQGGHIRLAVEAHPDHVLVRVIDDGIGIPAEALPRIFDIFTQLPRSQDRSEGGLGIGLTLVRRLVELHGGSVEARSEGPGKGSEFVVRLPRAARAVAPAPAPVDPGRPPPRRILVVDDNRDAAESLGMLLELQGNEVQVAHDGLEAVRSAAAFRPHVILLDLGLPKLSGYEAARRIRALDGGGGVLLVALTGWGQEDDRRRSRDAGFDHHLTKPVEFEALRRLLAGWSEVERGRSAGAP